MDWQKRTKLLIGEDGAARLALAHVAVFGIGGVGAYAAEAIARAGVGKIDLIDSDTVDITNINRQLIALRSTIGEKKTSVMSRRILDINPEAKIKTFDVFFSENTAELFDFSQYDYVIDAIDSVPSKLLMIKMCAETGTPIISSMGTGNKFDPSRFRVTDINKTSGCPLARVMRKRLRKMGINKLKVVFSDEEPVRSGDAETEDLMRPVPGTLSFVPPVAGMLLAGEVIRHIAEV